MAKTQGSSIPLKTLAPKTPITSTPRPPSVKKGTHVASTSDQQPADQLADDKKKGADNKEVLADLNDPGKKLRISTKLDPK
jgi:hypothetical protein